MLTANWKYEQPDLGCRWECELTFTHKPASRDFWTPYGWVQGDPAEIDIRRVRVKLMEVAVDGEWLLMAPGTIDRTLWERRISEDMVRHDSVREDAEAACLATVEAGRGKSHQGIGSK